VESWEDHMTANREKAPSYGEFFVRECRRNEGRLNTKSYEEEGGGKIASILNNITIERLYTWRTRGESAGGLIDKALRECQVGRSWRRGGLVEK